MSKLHVVIPAAGLGTRMRPLSNGLSKTLIPLNGRPILSWILDSISKLNAEIEDITVVTNDSGDIKRFIDTTYKGTNIYNKLRCVVQDKTYNGPGGAILSGVNSVEKDGGYLIWLGDTVCTYTDFEFGDNIFVATSAVDINTSNRWCIPVEKDENVSFLNKPSRDEIQQYFFGSIDALIGIYYFPRYGNQFLLDQREYQNRTDEIQVSELIDNSGISVDIVSVGNTWYDCGELDSFYESKARLLNLSCREQSGLEVDPVLGTVKKYARNSAAATKLKSELEWYQNRKGNQRLFIPKIIDNDSCSYTMELAPGNTLSDMFVYENVPVNVWKSILAKVVDIYHKHFAFGEGKNRVAANLIDANDVYSCLVDSFYINRTCMRLLKNNMFYQSLGVDCDIQTCVNFITSFADEIKQQYKDQYKKYETSGNKEYYPRNIIRIDNKSETFCANIHGDFHLGNILFDSLTGKFTFLDPRGGTMWSDYVDSYYDMGKLYHDIYCGYMLIIRGMYTNNNGTIAFSPYYQEVMDELVNYLDNYLETKYNYNPELIKKLAIIQVLTCIPFHMDDETRCKIFLTRAMNLINTSKYK